MFLLSFDQFPKRILPSARTDISNMTPKHPTELISAKLYVLQFTPHNPGKYTLLIPIVHGKKEQTRI